MARYRIKAVAHMLGIRPELLRRWEQRYQLFAPQRADNRYREFDDEDVQLLRYLCQQIAQGRAIGELAAEGREALLRQSRVPVAAVPAAQPEHARLIDALLAATCHFDKYRLEALLTEGAALYSFTTVLTHIVTPWMHRVGDLWAAGQLPMACERLATVVISQRLLTMLQATVPVAPAPVLICACPAGESHTLGLLIFAYVMQQAGWQAYYLGADLPCRDLQYACQQVQPALVALSVTHTVDQPHCLDIVRELDARLGGTCPTWVGGQAITRYGASLQPHRVRLVPSLEATQALAAHGESPRAAESQAEAPLAKDTVRQ
ncbi:MAG: MerR family transcriptional regulator [Candidatus Tectomicrobia bacterium]|uniref:MerR family transcriptional regulator n=1 Tax=Tectimicrobiota bacterium TaxID=2528274 RepID=A0A937W2M0_UNCTE|nr:MerR family transcriptional regulator [Candidatus Tectomicrobia bacterium]